jgi:Zn-dependent protease with chaperone function
MDTKFSVIYQGKLVDSKLLVDVERNLQEQYKFSPEKSKNFLSKSRVVKSGLNQNQAKKLQDNFLALGIETLLIKDSKIKLKSSADDRITNNKIEQLFKGNMLPVQTSFSYNLGLFFTLLLTLCMPLIYMAITFWSIYSTIWFGVNATEIMDFKYGAVIKLLMTFSVLFMGTLLSLFLLRPLIPQSYTNYDQKLKSTDHPQLFYLVKKLSEYMSVPMPSEIRVNSEVNASASLKDGLRSMFSGDLVLTIGLPLIVGMNTRQLVGVIAHEFGHFSQRYGMTVYYAINYINFWLRERAFSKYGLALALKRWSEKYESDYLLIPIWTARAGIWLSQQILKKLYQFSMYISQYMTRQMEYNADHYECKLVGSDYFSETSFRLHELSYARTKLRAINGRFWDENLLFKDIPSAVNHVANELSKSEKMEVQQGLDDQSNHPWDSHPADTLRIEHAIATQETGIFTLKIPAICLFNNIKLLCEEETLVLYCDQGVPNAKRYVRENDYLFTMQKENELSHRLERSLKFGIDLGRRLPNIPVKLPDTLKDASLPDIHAAFVDSNERIKKIAFSYNQADSKRYSHNRAHAFMQAGFKIDTRDFQLTDKEALDIKRTVAISESEFEQCEVNVLIYDQLITAKILAALSRKSSSALPIARNNIQSLKLIKQLEKQIEQVRVYSDCIDILIENDGENDDESYLIESVIKTYQNLMAPIIRNIWIEIEKIPAVNRFSSENINVLEFSETWHAKPIVDLEKVQAHKLSSYSDILGSAIKKQYDLHLKNLLILIQ